MKLLSVICGVFAGLALLGMATGQDKDAVKEEMKKLDGTPQTSRRACVP